MCDADRDAYADLVEALRSLQDSLHVAALPDDQAATLAAQMRELAAVVRSCAVPEQEEIVSRRPDLPGRGNAMLPGFVMHEAGPQADEGTGQFSVAFRGRCAVHGGAIALLFDEALGRLAERVADGSRTAYLRIDFLVLTPVAEDLNLQATIDKVDRRKIYISGRLSRGGDAVATAHGLWVAPRPEHVPAVSSR
jgi:hypothetical protein